MIASNYRPKPAQLTLLLLVFALGACGTTPPSNFYLLEPMSQNDTRPIPVKQHSMMHIGIGPIQFPGYLDRTQIVTRSDSTQLNLSETHRWAEPLQNNFARILAENLSLLLNTDKVTLRPSRNWPDIDYQILVDVWQLDADRQGNATLVANWSIRTDKGTSLLFMKKSEFTTAIKPAASYTEIATALSKTIEMLSNEIAEVIGEQGRRQSLK
jgi:uncharacterized lipoprotein YmbA